MANQYRRGARAENRVADVLRERGYDVIRSAASKGSADLVAIHDGELVLVQVKLTDKTLPSPLERTQLIRVARRAGAVPVIAYLSTRPGRATEYFYRELTGPGPKEWEHWIPRNKEGTTEL